MEEKDPLEMKGVLSQWSVTTPLPRNFKANVWQQIAARQSRSSFWRVAIAWLDGKLARPAPALAYLAMLLVAGLVAGEWKAHVETSQMEKALLTRYVQSVDPYQARVD